MNFAHDSPLIYLITPGAATSENFSQKGPEILASIERAVAERVDLVQIREKHLTARKLFDLSKAAAGITASTGTKLLINDRADVALAAGADGVHLTEGSLATAVVRRAFPSQFVIGVSAHSLSEAAAVAEQGADLAVFGPVFGTPGKGVPMGLDALAEISRRLRPFPILALGGVDTDNYSSVLEAGASGFAAIRALNNAESLRTISRELKK